MFYWIYDIPTWLFGVLTVALFVAVSCGGLVLTRGWIQTHLRLSDDSNEAVNAYFSGVGVLYGLLLGLVAVATWQNFEDVSGLVSKEAAVLGGLYRDISSYPEPLRQELQGHLRDYAHYVIEQAWPAQQQGQVPTGGTRILSRFQSVLLAFEPGPGRQTVLHGEALHAFNQLVEARRLRLDAVDTGLSPVLWTVVLIGAALSVFVTYFLHLGDRKVHLILTATLATFIGLMVFLTASLDNPFRGHVGVSADSYRLILDGLMNLAPEPDPDERENGGPRNGP